MNHLEFRVAVIGLGYVGLPLASSLSKRFEVVGFDLNSRRISELQNGFDSTRELSPADLAASPNILLTNNEDDIRACNVFIVTVPTPIDQALNPDFTPLVRASEMVSSKLKKGDVVVLESTVYPGATEEIMVPLLEKDSNLIADQDFYVGYSPERINPGDTAHRLENVVKVVGSNSEVGRERLTQIYGPIISAGIHVVSSMKVAEMAKVIENVQRDVNIALMNELAVIADKVDVNIYEVLEAAGTKWNFLNFKPGLVGGHCIGVDPYYLIHKAKQVGFNSDLILAARRANESTVSFFVSKILKAMFSLQGTKRNKVLLLGCTFKPDCPDLRNSKVFECASELSDYGISVFVHDPFITGDEPQFSDSIVSWATFGKPEVGLAVLMVEHKAYIDLGVDGIQSLCGGTVPILDLKNAL